MMYTFTKEFRPKTTRLFSSDFFKQSTHVSQNDLRRNYEGGIIVCPMQKKEKEKKAKAHTRTMKITFLFIKVYSYCLKNLPKFQNHFSNELLFSQVFNLYSEQNKINRACMYYLKSAADNCHVQNVIFNCWRAC